MVRKRICNGRPGTARTTEINVAVSMIVIGTSTNHQKMRTTIVLGILFVFCHGCSVTTLERTEETAVISCEAAHVTIHAVADRLENETEIGLAELQVGF